MISETDILVSLMVAINLFVKNTRAHCRVITAWLYEIYNAINVNGVFDIIML